MAQLVRFFVSRGYEESPNDLYLKKKVEIQLALAIFFYCRNEILGKRFRSFPSPSSPSHQFLLEAENKIDFKGATPDLFFSQNCSDNLHFGMERVDLVGRGG